jgi:outer membrane autotransporter protein
VRKKSNPSGRFYATRSGLLATTALISLALLPAAPHSADAQTVWTGAINPGWNTAGNWSTNAVPTAADSVIVDTSGGTVIISSSVAATYNDLVVNSSATGFGLDVLSGGTLTGAATNGGATIGQSAGSTAQMAVYGAGSTWTIPNGQLIVGGDGTGTLLIHSSGAVSASNFDAIIANNVGSAGTVTVTGVGSTLSLTDDLYVGGAGNGRLNIFNGGAVTSANGFVGSSATGVGTVTVAGAATMWTLTGANLIVGDSGAGALTLGSGGIVTVGAGAGAVTIANNVGSTGTLNIGNGGPAGTLNAAAIQFGTGGGSLVFNHTDTSYTFAPMISGNGGIYHAKGVTTLSGNSAAFTGTTSLSGGSLYVNGTLGGSLNVSGGILGGAGTVGAVTVDSGGTIAPGNSIGALNVASMIFNAGSTYTVELNDAGNTAGVNNDHISATGAVTINGGTVHVTPVNGTDNGTTYTAGTVYTIITAAGGVNGTFTSLTDDYAFLNFALSYDASNVYLTSQLAATSFCLPGMTANQCAAGNGVFSLGAGSLYTAVLNLGSAEAPGALNQLSGEIHASAKTALIEDSRFVREAALSRVRSAFESAGASTMPVFAYASAGLQAAPASTDRFAVWGQAFGAFGHADSDGNAARLGRSSGGLFIGGDGAVTDHWRLGALGGYSRSRFDVDVLSSSGSSDNYHAGVYGGGEWGAFGLRYGGAYSWHDLHTTRRVAFTGFSDRLAAGYRAGTGQVFGEVGYQFGAGGARYEPFANLAYVNLHTHGFTESGGAAALFAASQSTDTAFTTLGVRAQTTLVAGPSEATLRGMLGWRHAYGDVVPTSIMTFAAGGSAFTIAGVPIARDALVFDAGLDVKLMPAALLGFSYGGQFGSGVTDQSMKANLTVKF